MFPPRRGPYGRRVRRPSESAGRPTDARRTGVVDGDRAAFGAARSNGEASMIRTLPLLRAVGCCALATATLIGPALIGPAWSAGRLPAADAADGPTGRLSDVGCADEPARRRRHADHLGRDPEHVDRCQHGSWGRCRRQQLPADRGRPQPRVVRELLRHARVVLRRAAVHGRHRHRRRPDGLQPSLHRRRNDRLRRRLLHRVT